MPSQFADDDRFYDTLNKAGDQYRSDRYRVAEEQANHAREMGNIYGQMLPNTLNAAMKGADWRQNRDINNQTYQNRTAEEGRAQENQGFNRAQEGRTQKTFDTQLPMYQDQAAGARINLDRARRDQEYENTPVGAEEASQVGYKGKEPLSHYQLAKLRGEQGDSLALDTGKQNLANAKQQASAVAQQIAQNASTFKNQEYNFQAQKAANELDNVYMIKDPAQQAAALTEWRGRYSSTLLDPQALTNMAAGGAAKREGQMKAGMANDIASTKLIYGSAVQEAQAMTDKLAATQQLAQNAKVYDQNASLGGAWENDNAKDARQSASLSLTSLGKHHAADQVRNGVFAQGRGLLTEQAKQQANETLAEFNNWYARQDDKVQQLPEVKRAFQQAQELQTQMGQAAGSPTLTKLPSLVGGSGANTEANRSFLTGGIPPGGAQGYAPPPGLAPPPAVPASYFNQQPRATMPAPAPGPGQQFSPGQVMGGQHLGPPQQDPYGLMKSGKPPKGGAYGSR